MPAAGPGPTRVWPPRRIGIGAVGRRRASAAQPRVGDPLRQQQVGGEPVLGGRPARLVGARADGRAGPGCRRAPRRRAGPGAPRATRAGPSRTIRAARRATERRPAAGPSSRARPQAALLDERARPRRRCAARASASVAADVRPATSSSARGSAATARTPASRARRGRDVDRDAASPRDRRAARGRAGRRCRRRAASGAAGRRPRSRRAPRASAAARCRRAGPGSPGASRPRRWRRRRRSSGCWRAPAGRPPPAAATNARRSAAVASGIAPSRGRRGRPAAAARDEVAEPRAERRLVGRPADDADVARAGRREAGRVPLGDRPARTSASQRSSGPGVRARPRVQDADADRAHGPESSRHRRRRPVPDRRVRAYIGLGANLGDAEATLAAAVRALAALPGVRVRASRACTRPRRWASPTSPSSATPSSPWTSPAGPDPPTGALELLASLKDDRARVRPPGRADGARASSTSTCSCSAAHRIGVERTAGARSIDAGSDPAKAARSGSRSRTRQPRRLFVLAPLADLAPGSCRPAGARRSRPRGAARSRSRRPGRRSGSSGSGTRRAGGGARRTAS